MVAAETLAELPARRDRRETPIRGGEGFLLTTGQMQRGAAAHPRAQGPVRKPLHTTILKGI